jgi:hypothetical protein
MKYHTTEKGSIVKAAKQFIIEESGNEITAIKSWFILHVPTSMVGLSTRAIHLSREQFA